MKLHIMKYRKIAYIISGALVLLSVLSLLFRGLNYGIDFAGGISMEVTPVEQSYTIDKMRAALSEFSPELQQVDG
ncbi:MAG: protein translocase subunit SecF, partial [Alphaproteobacteria bacterium]|nr:protein translocase subunit SecF [Alphaproteobacteria bacterium]